MRRCSSIEVSNAIVKVDGETLCMWFTSSTVPFMMYLVTITFLDWPMRTARATACASTEGFQCGSITCTWFAVVRLSLCRALEKKYVGKGMEEMCCGLPDRPCTYRYDKN